MAISSAIELQPVASVTARLQDALDLARVLKPAATVEPPLPITDLANRVSSILDDIGDEYDQAYRFAAVETAARDIFYSCLNSTSISEPSFVQVWNLLDILLLGGDTGQCAPELVCWLLEELLDSQTTDGCRTVFDYLESRRERLAQKDFHKKNLVFLRSCNALLRRLSRAEDAVFCGRVFFFLFQTFPLGDKSSVNLRGEFHVENTTVFEAPLAETAAMTLDAEHKLAKIDDATPKTRKPASEGTPQPTGKPASQATHAKAGRKLPEEDALDNGVLYAIFWSLQRDFSDPVRLFKSANFEPFKKALGATVTKFRKTPTVVQTKVAEEGKRGLKRKADEATPVGGSGHFADNYNPKYLTSQDLFDLELSDLAFQRHILVQALILLDFLLSLTERSKKKLLALEHPNKSLLYDLTLSEEDTKWALSSRTTIKTLFHTTSDGRFYDRMVDTILARDKNWVRWKIESCPSIVRDPVSIEEELGARSNARRYTKPRRVDAKAVGAMDLSFLEEGQGGGLEALKESSRYSAPSVDRLLEGVRTDRLDLDMAMDDEEKAGLENMIQNKTWRALRQARITGLGSLDRVEPGKDLEEAFRPQPEVEHEDQTVSMDDSEMVDQPTTSAEGEASQELPSIG